MCNTCYEEFKSIGEEPPEGVKLVGHRKPTNLEIQNGLKLESLAVEILNRYKGENNG